MVAELEVAVALKVPDTEAGFSTVPAATVIFRPDAAHLSALLRVLVRGERRLFLFVNGPLDDSVEAQIALLANAHVVRSPDNVGLGAGLNALCQAAEAEGFGCLVVFDQDSAPEPELVDSLYRRFSEFERRGARPALLAPLLITPPTGNYRHVRYFWRQRHAGTVDFAPTSGSLISLPAWRRIGPFRADFFVGAIDVEWGFRAWRNGYSCLVAQDIRMIHRWGVERKDKQCWAPQILRQSDARTYFYLRNEVVCMGLSHIPAQWKARRVFRVLAQIALLLCARRFTASTWKVIWRGLGDGWRNKLGPPPRDMTPE